MSQGGFKWRPSGHGLQLVDIETRVSRREANLAGIMGHISLRAGTTSLMQNDWMHSLWTIFGCILGTGLGIVGYAAWPMDPETWWHCAVACAFVFAPPMALIICIGIEVFIYVLEMQNHRV